MLKEKAATIVLVMIGVRCDKRHFSIISFRAWQVVNKTAQGDGSVGLPCNIRLSSQYTTTHKRGQFYYMFNIIVGSKQDGNGLDYTYIYKIET